MGSRAGQRLLIEIAALPAADHARVDRACSLMSLVHAGDRRQREPYASRPLRVSIRILSHYCVRDPDVTCAASCTTRSKTTPPTSHSQQHTRPP
jgi:hypothetical protein